MSDTIKRRQLKKVCLLMNEEDYSAFKALCRQQDITTSQAIRRFIARQVHDHAGQMQPAARDKRNKQDL